MRSVATALWLGLLVTACAGPTPPLLSPLEHSQRHGYSDRDLAPDRLEVSYQGPRHRRPAPGPTMVPEPLVEPVRAEALDLATWRAAQLSLARGYKGLRVVERQSVVDARAEQTYAGADWGPWPTWRYPTGFVYGPPGYVGASYAYVQARATLTVQLVATPQGDDLDAAETIARLRAAYPGAEATAPPRQAAAAAAVWSRDPERTP